jgi:hypothetical protein
VSPVSGTLRLREYNDYHVIDVGEKQPIDWDVLGSQSFRVNRLPYIAIFQILQTILSYHAVL